MLFTLHLLLMPIASAGIIAGVSAAIFFRKKKYWLKIHKLLNSTGILVMSIGITIAFILAFVTMLLGFHQFKAKNKPLVRTMHRWLGRLSLLLFLTAITLGLMLINIL